MDLLKLDIDPDIRLARTPPSAIYRDPRQHERALVRIFVRSWQLLPPEVQSEEAGSIRPWTLLPGSLDEPLVLTRDDQGRQHCVSNVCTHRGNLVVQCPGKASGLRCGYHGRRFGLDGRFLSMPEFEQTQDFPSDSDHLPALPLEHWGCLGFTAIDPVVDFETWIAPVRARMDWLPLDRFRFDAASSRDYDVASNWMLYCDNFLEGFHIPYVHHGLASELDCGAYVTETFEWGSLQLGIGRQKGEPLGIPQDHPDAGRGAAAYYYWLFPNLMLNFYPWGLSVNVVQPLAVDRTRVRFLSFVRDVRLRDSGAGADLHRVELEDEVVVRNVQRGLRSRMYDRGRYSPTREAGVHHFHRLLARLMD